MPQASASHQDEVCLRGLTRRAYVQALDLGAAAWVEHALTCLPADVVLSLELSGQARPADLETLVPAPPGPGRHEPGTSTTGALA